MSGHDGYELCRFFNDADAALKDKVLLELCKREPDLLLQLVRAVDISAGLMEITMLMRVGRKIDAIKLYRNITGTTLKEAKEFVEAMKL